MSDNITFTRDLIKGKITELVFQQMILEGGKYEPTPLGYENSLPQLAHMAKYNKKVNEITKQLRHTPDFVLIEKGGDKVYLVEIKYEKVLPEKDKIKQIAQMVHDKWEHTWLFIATQDKFYMDYCWDVIENNGEINNKIEEFGLTPELQLKYIRYIQEFIKPAT